MANLYKAFSNFQLQQAEQLFANYLNQTISVRDTFNRVNLKENFYHGLLLGVLSGNDQWNVKSKQEAGNGYADIVVETPKVGMVFEIKYAHDDKLELRCEL